MIQNLIQNIQGDWQQWSIGAAVVLIVAVLLRMAKKQQWSQKLQVVGVNCGKWFSILLLRWLPPVAAEKAEEGIFVTALSLIKCFCDGFEMGILSDNAKNLKEQKEAEK